LKAWLAPAKINLFLHVVGQYDDGYHELQSIFQLLDWCDELEFECSSDGSIRRLTKIDGIAERDDIVIRTANLLRQRFPGPAGVAVRCHKRVPVGAGLGGGSSDAATTLRALNELWELGLRLDQLAEIGLELGADVPIFVYGKNAWVEGRGEVLSEISIPEQLYLVVYPACVVSTKKVFTAFQGPPYRKKLPIEPLDALAQGNDLEAITCRLYPAVRQALDLLRNWGAPHMSGSGSALFMHIESVQAGETILSELPEAWTGRVCVGRGS